jgi:hypothetical protein
MVAYHPFAPSPPFLPMFIPLNSDFRPFDRYSFSQPTCFASIAVQSPQTAAFPSVPYLIFEPPDFSSTLCAAQITAAPQARPHSRACLRPPATRAPFPSPFPTHCVTVVQQGRPRPTPADSDALAQSPALVLAAANATPRAIAFGSSLPPPFSPATRSLQAPLLLPPGQLTPRLCGGTAQISS